MANSKLLWPTQDEERQRQELMGEMMQARGVDVAAVSRVDGGLALLEADHQMPPLPGGRGLPPLARRSNGVAVGILSQ